MLDEEERMEISVLSRQGQSIRSICPGDRPGAEHGSALSALRRRRPSWKVRFTSAADLMLAMEKAQRQNQLKDFVHCTSPFRRGDYKHAQSWRMQSALRATVRRSPA